MIVFQSMRLVLAGLAVGLIAAFVLTRVLSATLTELSGFDPLMLMSMCGILLGVPLAAAVVPAQRAARIDPIVALRYE